MSEHGVLISYIIRTWCSAMRSAKTIYEECVYLSLQCIMGYKHKVSHALILCIRGENLLIY